MFRQKATNRNREIDYDKRGMKEDAYVCTNGVVEQGAIGAIRDHWDPDLTFTAASNLAQGTTLLSLWNTDNYPPAAVCEVYNNVATKFGVTALWRPIFIDEVSINVTLHSGVNFYNYMLTCNLLWMDEGAMAVPMASNRPFDYLTTFRNTCESYMMANWRTDERRDENGDLIFTLAGIIPEYRRRWGPDMLYNAAVGGTEQTGYEPIGAGPNAIVAFADASGEQVGVNHSRILRAFLPVTPGRPCSYKPHGSSLIVMPGQAVSIQVENLAIPPPGFSANPLTLDNPISPSGNISIAASIAFRQPLLDEPFSWNRWNQFEDQIA